MAEKASFESVLTAWESYARGVMPPDAHRTRRVETRRASYAGAWFILQVMERIGRPDMPEDAGVDWLDRMVREIESFYRGGG